MCPKHIVFTIFSGGASRLSHENSWIPLQVNFSLIFDILTLTATKDGGVGLKIMSSDVWGPTMVGVDAKENFWNKVQGALLI